MVFEIVTTDGTIERVDGADAYELEGPLTTFFTTNSGIHRLSSWSERVASYRTDRVLAVRTVPAVPLVPAES
ncbi:MAG TPA: hypothetical protein VH914_04675 [Acidimicrobiia bacterium]|jgi:hypothetical protein|nr:hypothetical protein [Acidimicrobiia bacterium]